MTRATKQNLKKLGSRRQGGSTKQSLSQWANVPRSLEMPFRRADFIGTLGLVALDTGGGFSFALDQLPGYTDFTNLFDRYCLESVDVTWTLVKHAAGQAWPTVWMSEDLDDVTAPTFAEIQQRANAEALQFNDVVNKFTRRISPRVAMAIFNGVTNAYAVGPAKCWLNVSYPGTPHYGYKYFVENYNTTSTAGSAIEVTHTYNFKLKSAA